MMRKILIIEDERGIADTIIYSLTTEGFESIWVSTGEAGIKKTGEESIDLIILDIGLPDISGFELIKQIRKKYGIPVIFLTARSDEIDRIVGFELGADDYVVKPFSPRELTARVKAVLRRRSNEKINPHASGDSPFDIDPNKRQILFYGEKLNLSRYEYEILCLLCKRPGWVFTREKIMEMVWAEPEESFDRTVDAHIKTLRAKLKTINPDCDPIETHRGIGYSLREKL